MMIVRDMLSRTPFPGHIVPLIVWARICPLALEGEGWGESETL